MRKILPCPLQPRYPQAVRSDYPQTSLVVDLTQLGQSLRTTFVALVPDAVQREFVDRSRATPHSRLLTLSHRILRTFISDYDVNGLLGMYPMHLLSTAQWRVLLGSKPGDRLLDVGAGDGGLTRQLAPLFTSITTSETSRSMARRLKRQGYACLERDIAIGPFDDKYDCVTCLNVVDRTPRPRQLVVTLADALEPGGLLALATPLPMRAFYYDGPRTLEPKEALSAPGPSWERSATQFVDAVREVAPRLTLRSWTKAPYLSWGDSANGLYELHDFVGVWVRSTNQDTGVTP